MIIMKGQHDMDDHHKRQWISRKNAIGLIIGAYLIGLSGGLFLYPLLGYQALLGYILCGIGLIVTTFFGIRNAWR